MYINICFDEKFVRYTGGKWRNAVPSISICGASLAFLKTVVILALLKKTTFISADIIKITKISCKDVIILT